MEQSGLETVMLDGARPVEAAIRYFRTRLARMAARLQERNRNASVTGHPTHVFVGGREWRAP